MKKVCLLLLLVGMAAPAFAEESQFGYVYLTDILPKGQKELEQWLTWRHQKSQGEFDVWEGRTALEYGVSDSLQMAIYANYTRTSFYHDDIDGANFPPESFAELQPGPNDHVDTTKFVGVSLEGIYRLMSPYTDPFGLSLYLEPTYGKDLFEMESRIILQKNFLEDRMILAFNVTAEQELRNVPGDPGADPGSDDAVTHWDKETDVNMDLGASYRFIPNWSAGFEFLNEREFSSLSISGEYRTNEAYYFGPSIHYGGEKFFVTMVLLEQLAWGSDYANPQPGYIVDGRNYADDFERYRVRLKVGYYF